MSARSLLYVPGVRPERFDKALASGADAIILDLEDAVPMNEKDAARAAVGTWLAGNAGARVWVRVNGGDLMAEDVRAVVDAGARALYVPKVSSAGELEALDALLDGTSVVVTALIETAAGVLDARAIAAAPRVIRLAIGEADLSAELTIDASDDGRELMPMRAHVVLASAAAGIDPPVGPVSTDFTDVDALRVSTRALKRMGFGARAAIHPAQVSVINDVFTPTADEIARARDVVARFEAARGGVCLDDKGRMVDEAIVRSARRIVAVADAP